MIHQRIIDCDRMTFTRHQVGPRYKNQCRFTGGPRSVVAEKRSTYSKADATKRVPPGEKANCIYSDSERTRVFLQLCQYCMGQDNQEE